jgi:hypothetical protein
MAAGAEQAAIRTFPAWPPAASPAQQSCREPGCDFSLTGPAHARQQQSVRHAALGVQVAEA